MNGTKPRWLVVILFTALAAVSGCGRPAPADTVKKFYVAVVNDRRYDEAVECMPKSTQQMIKTTGQEASLFSGWDNLFAKAPRIEKIVVTDEHINGNRATVKFDIHYAGGAVEKMKDNLVWEDGSWRIVMPNQGY